MIPFRRLLRLTKLSLLGIVIYALSKKVFLNSLSRKKTWRASLPYLDRATTSTLKILRQYPLEHRRKNLKLEKSFFSQVTIPEFLKRLPNIKNIDSLYGDCLALLGSASLEEPELAFHHLRIKITDSIREIRLRTWGFKTPAQVSMLEKLDLSAKAVCTEECKVFLPEFRQLSHNVYRAAETDQAAKVPPSAFEVYEDCCFLSSGAVLSQEKLIILHSSQRPENYFYMGHSEYRENVLNDTEVAVRLKVETENVLKEAIYIYCREGLNLYHWLMEVVPLALQIRENFSSRIPIILRGPLNRLFVAELTKIVENPLLQFNKETITTLLVQKLHVRSAPVNTADTFSPSYRELISSFDRKAVEQVRHWFLTSYGSESFRGEKIFLSRRSSHRGLLNEPRLQKLAERRGFVAVDPAGLGISKQIALFSHASTLVGAGGGVMGNYLFASPDSRIGQLVASQNLRLPAPALICQVSGAKFFSGVGASKPAESFRNPLDWQHSDFTLKEEDFESLLDHMEE